jgi:hypothetical protein
MIFAMVYGNPTPLKMLDLHAATIVMGGTLACVGVAYSLPRAFSMLMIFFKGYSDASCATLVGTMPGTPSNASGVVSFSAAQITKTNVISIQATDGTRSTSCLTGFTVSPGALSTFAVNTCPLPTTTTTDSAFTTQPKLTAQDANANTIPTYSGTLTFSGYTDAACTSLVASSVNGSQSGISSGLISFTGVQVLKTSVKYIQATDGSKKSTCIGALTVNPGVLSTLAFTTAPSSAPTSGVAFPQQPAVSAYDGNSNLLGSSTAITLSVSPAGAPLTCTTNPVTTASGVSTFAGCKLTGTAGSYTLTATSGAITNTASVTLGAGVPYRLVFVSPTTSLTANGCQSYTVQLQDQWFNTTTGSAYTLNLSDGSTGKFYNSSASCTAGTGNITSVSLASSTSSKTFWYSNQTASTPTLTVSATGITVNATQALTITAAGANKLGFTAVPASGTAGTALTSTVVQVQDAFGNAVSQADNITLTLATNPGSSTSFTSSLLATDASGKATFTGIILNKSGTGYSFSASSSHSYTSATSSTFNVAAGTANKLVFFTQPTNATAGVAIPSFQVKVQDSNSNDVTTSTASIALTPSASTIASGGTVVASGGVSTFASVIMNTAGSYTLTAASSGLTSAVSTPAFTVSPAAASAATSIITSTSPVLADGVATSTVTVTLKDAFSNVISGTTPTLSASGTGNTVNSCSATNGSGVSTCSMTSTIEGLKALSLSSPAIAPTNSGTQFYAVTMNTPVCDRAGTGTNQTTCNWGSITATTTTGTFTFKNISTGSVTLGASLYTISGGNSNRFSIQADNCSAQVLGVGASCTVQVNFLANALAAGTYSSSLIFKLPGTANTSTITITGTVQ